MIQLTKLQLQQELNNLITQEQGLNEILTMVLNALMYSERADFLATKNPGNKANGYRFAQAKGHGKLLSLSIPRDRLGIFKPLILTALREEEERVQEVCFELYGKGLTTRDIGPIVGKLYGQEYSPSAISRISQKFQEQMEQWRTRPLEKYYPVVYLDATYIKVRRDTVCNEAFYVVLGLREDTTREVLAIENLPQESAQGWADILASLRRRGVETINLIIGDGLAGLETAAGQHFPKASFQKCVVHWKRNMLYRLRSIHKEEMAKDLARLFDIADSSYTPEKAFQRAAELQDKWAPVYPVVRRFFEPNELASYFTYLSYPISVRPMLYTTNWIERLHKEFRRTIKIRNALPSVEATLLLLCKVACDQEAGAYRYPIPSFKFELVEAENVDKKLTQT